MSFGHGRFADLDEGGGLVVVLSDRRPLRFGRRQLARCEEARLAGAGGAEGVTKGWPSALE